MNPALVVLEVVLVVLVVAGVWSLATTASRLDRLHKRVEGARAALDNQLLRRATAAGDVASSGLLDPASALLIAGAAAEAIAAGEGRAAQLAADPLSRSRMADHDPDHDADLEAAESDLSRALRATLDELPDELRHELAAPGGTHALVVLAAACHRVTLARRFHNDAATQSLRLRRKRLVRWARLAGTAPFPRTVELDDEPPRALLDLALPSGA